MLNRMIILPLLVLTAFAGCVQDRGGYNYDMMVLGSNPGGVAAAVAAARRGMRVGLVSPTGRLGGMMASGLGSTDVGNPDYLGGISAGVFRRIARYYRETYGEQSPQYEACGHGFSFEPHVAEAVFEELVAAERNIEVLRGWRFVESRGELNRVESLVLEQAKSGERKQLNALFFIDATYTGDLLADAGAPFYTGRESREVFDETLAGHIWQDPETREPLPGSTGEGDSLVQAYNYRLCVTDSLENSVEWPEPESYDPGRYEVLYSYIRSLDDPSPRDFMIFSPLPNRKYDVNNWGYCWLSTDLVGGSQGYPQGTDEQRREIEKRHMDHILGLWKFLGTDPGVPEELRRQFQRYRPAADEFTGNGHLPWQIYVREGRRLHGVYTFSERDALADTLKQDAVGMGSYPMDSHATGPRRPGYPWAEGFFIMPVRPYQIPYFIMTPVWVRNLLVPVCVSASHVGYGTLRMEPIYMIMGQAAGVAASLAREYNCEVDEVFVPELREILAADGVVISHDRATPWKERLESGAQGEPLSSRRQ